MKIIKTLLINRIKKIAQTINDATLLINNINEEIKEFEIFDKDMKRKYQKRLLNKRNENNKKDFKNKKK